MDEPTAQTAGDSLERKVPIDNLYSKYSRNPRLVWSMLDSNSVTAGEVPLYKPHPRKPQGTFDSIIHNRQAIPSARLAKSSPQPL